MGKRLHFVLTMAGGMEAMRELWSRFTPEGQRVLNRTEWMGKEPRSCAVTSVKSRPRAAGDPSPIVFDIEVSYRPKGQITYVGSTRYDGWTAMVPNETSDPQAYVPRQVYDDVEFNDLDFGEFVGEVDEDGVKHIAAEAVMNEIMASGKFIASVHSSFMAPRRSRPYKKIVLSGSPSGEFIDGFGTHIVNINNTTPNLEQLLTDSLIGLMCEFVEGKASIKSIGNDAVTLVELSDSLVDCAPNEDGMDSFFDILHLHTSADFLDDLAKRLMSIYAVDVAVVDGEKCGLVLRRAAHDA